MGTLRYNGSVVEFDDRLLAHLQIVIVEKIRRGEAFLMSWSDTAGTGDGHSAIWIHPKHVESDIGARLGFSDTHPADH